MIWGRGEEQFIYHREIFKIMHFPREKIFAHDCRNRDFYRRHLRDTKLYRNTVRSSAMQGMPQNPNHKIELIQGQLEVYKISKEKLYSRCMSLSPYNNNPLYGHWAYHRKIALTKSKILRRKENRRIVRKICRLLQIFLSIS